MAPFATLVSTAWLLAILTAPLLPTTLSASVYAVGSLVCHQRPERSFHIGELQLAVCARCVGIYAGAAIGALAVAAQSALKAPPHMRPAGIFQRGRWMLVVGALPTAITVALEGAGLWPTTNIVRAVAGFPLGLAAALVVTGALATINYGNKIRT
jgi:uncharacterized membrane protein